MTLVWIIVGLAILFIVLRLSYRGSSTATWKRVLQDPELLEIPYLSDLPRQAQDFLLPDKINVIKFFSNLSFLITDGFMRSNPLSSSQYFDSPTPSIQSFDRVTTRPVGIPHWFTAAYPDVVRAVSDGELEIADEAWDEELGEDDEIDLQDYDNPTTKPVLRKMISEYQRQIRKRLETQ